ncbi:MAG: nuclear transport factor 2 family protein [Deltaproteobacteria bacterium]|nr:nuclear transport factor 2 family protein [Deltaproteobacteria bacterium]MBI3386646.1 nuclear transport factor 2 family protein [Deltaproteobacteria bacterium]
MSTENENVVRKFCAAFARRNIQELLSFFAEDAVYHNVPVEPVHGHDGIRNTFEMFVAPAEKIEFEILHMSSVDDIVMNERIDRFLIAGRQVALPVAGVFVIRNGKIAAWRDYFDMQMFMKQSGMA